MTTYEELAPVFDRLDRRCDGFYVAGGAAVDLSKASDIDVWFSKKNHTAANAFLAKFEIRSNDEKVYTMSEFRHGLSTIVGEAYCPELHRMVQVLVSYGGSADSCIELFDISTHMRAITSRGRIIVGDLFTFPDERPRVEHPTPKSLQRYVKICARYGHVPDMDVIRRHWPTKTQIEENEGLPLGSGHLLGKLPVATANLPFKKAKALMDESMKALEHEYMKKMAEYVFAPSPFLDYLKKSK